MIKLIYILRKTLEYQLYGCVQLWGLDLNQMVPACSVWQLGGLESRTKEFGSDLAS